MGTVKGSPLPGASTAAAAAFRTSIQGLKDVAREWLSEGIDPRDPVVKALMTPMFEEALVKNGSMNAFRTAMVDPWDALCAAADAVEAEDPA